MLAVWEAMYRLEPWGDDWLQAARIEAAVVNKDSSDPVSPYDLIPNEDNRPADENDDPAAINAAVRSRCGL